MIFYEKSFHCNIKAQQFIHGIIGGQARFIFTMTIKNAFKQTKKSFQLFQNNSIWREKYILKYVDLPNFNCQAANNMKSLYLKIPQISFYLTVKISM